jgi:bilirubin oxidase
MLLGFTALAFLFTGLWAPAYGEALPGGTLKPTNIKKYVRPLTVPPAMPKSDETNTLDYYEIAVRQFKQEIVPGLLTDVWGYGSLADPMSFNYPAYTIEAEYNKPVRVKWINDLKDANGDFLPHLLPIDQTLHWANPPQDCSGEMMGGAMAMTMTETDCRSLNPAPYNGPVPMVPHLHGAHVTQDSDGYPEAWFLPAAVNIPDGYARYGSKYLQFKAEAEAAYGQTWEPGTAVYQYPNDQRAATLWFHDHSLGMTRANVYAGPAGFYLIRGGDDDLSNVLPAGAYEIPLVIQDRSFNKDGSLFYPADRAFFEGLSPSQLQIPFIPDMTLDDEPSDISPIWNPEFFGNTMVVNGNTWPYLDVEQRRYRFRILNASDSRFFYLKLSNGQKFWQIGNDGGFLSAPAKLESLLIAPAERADIIIDFTGAAAGTNIILENLGPDEPFGGGEPGIDFDPADPGTTGQVMQFRVVAIAGTDATIPLDDLSLPTITPISGNPKIRELSLNELMSMTVFIPVDENEEPILDKKGNLVAVPADHPNAMEFGPAAAQLGTMENGEPVPYPWMAGITEKPKVNQTEDWVLYNFTADAHPIHLHQIQFEVIERIDQDGNVTGPEPWETGFKDTVIAYPGDEGDNPGITRIRVKFDIPGLFVWHCHILSHEDNEMMRPIEVVGPPKNKKK